METLEEQVAKTEDLVQRLKQVMHDETIGGVLKRMSLYQNGAAGSVLHHCLMVEKVKVVDKLSEYIGEDYSFHFNSYHEFDIKYKNHAIGTLYMGSLEFHFKRLDDDIEKLSLETQKLKTERVKAIFTDEADKVNRTYENKKRLLAKKISIKNGHLHPIEEKFLETGVLTKRS